MSAVQPFPTLASADNSRSGSPARDSTRPAANPRRHNSHRRHKKGAPQGDAQPGPRHRPQKPKAVDEAIAEARDNTPSSDPASSAGGARRRNGRKNGAKRRGQQASAPSESVASSSRPTSSLMSATPAGQPTTGTLSMPMIIAGEDGRARVVFNAQPDDLYRSSPEELYHHPLHHEYQHQHQHRFYASPPPTSYGHSLALGEEPPAQQYLPAEHAIGAPPGFRHRSMTSTQLQQHHPDTRSYSPQLSSFHRPPPHPGHPSQHQDQTHRFSSVIDAPAYPHTAPLTAEAGSRGRSQSVSTHVSMTGLRISLAQSQPGNVMSPHLPLLARGAYGAPGQAPHSAYAGGGYFASRRASVSNVGLAVDPSHSIRIPTIMFQRPRSDSAAAPKDTAAGEPITPQSGRPAADACSSEAAELTGEDLAMQRLQDMISSLRALGTGRTATAPEEPAPKVLQSEEAADADEEPETPIAMLPTPAAHPTSRFDSILEEDEDTDDDDDDVDGPSASVGPVAAAAAAVHPVSALCAL
ncbi:hypothetical protein H4R19_002457 [Coemansia spiralis]|nr:hypothetical protein H4R19_002457 [Coemansia spiralis]